MRPRRFLLVAGEASGDMYGADVARALYRKFPGCRIFGLGGSAMRAACVDLVSDIARTAVVGPFEAIGHMKALYDVFRELAMRCEADPPDAAILIDFPDFNLRLAKRLKEIRTPVIYYVSPQVWAWRSGRIDLIREVVDKMLVIFPFEEDLYRNAGINVEFVGHPLIELAKPTKTKDEFCRLYKLNPRAPIVSLLPGSRKKEIRYILPTILNAATLLRREKPDLQFVLPVAANLERGFVEEFVPSAPVTVVYGETYNALKYSRAAIVASGTATLEAALLGTPEVVVYRISGATWFLGKFLLKTRRFGIVNIILNEDVVPELFQDRMTPEAIAKTALRLIDDVWVQSQMRSKYEILRRKLGTGKAPERVADAVAGLVSSAPTQTTG